MISSAALIAALVLAGPDENDANLALQYSGNRGVIVALKEIQVPAEVAGKLKSVSIQEGTLLKDNVKIAQVDDTEVLARQKIAQGEFEVAQSQVRAAPLKHLEAQYTMSVAGSEYDASLAMNKQEPNTVSKFELRRQKLTRDRAEVQMKTAAEELKQANATLKTKQAQLDAINQEVKRYQILAPKGGGRIVEILKKEGEWVRQGDTVVRILQLNKLKVETFVKMSQYRPEDIDGKHLDFVIGKRKFSAKVTFVNPTIESSGEYRISAIVDNVKTAKGYWVLRPGMNLIITVR